MGAKAITHQICDQTHSGERR